MYLNFNKYTTSNLSPEHLLLLIAIKQKEEEFIELFWDGEMIEQWKENELIKTLKNGQVRVDKKGSRLLKDLSSSGGISKETETIVEWLIGIYKNKENGIVRNKAETKRRCQWFSEQTGIEKNELAMLLRCFLTDTYSSESGMTVEEFKRDNPRMVLSNLLDNIFWTPPNNFARNYTLDDSPLYRYMEDNREYLDKIIFK